MDASGRFCVQCSQANEILVRTLRLAFKDQSEWTFDVISGWANDMMTLLPNHALTEMRKYGNAVALFDATPMESDVRAPSPGSFVEKKKLEKLRSAQNELMGRLKNLIQDVGRRAPKYLPESSAFWSFAAAAKRAVLSLPNEDANLESELNLMSELASQNRVPGRDKENDHVAFIKTSLPSAQTFASDLKVRCAQLLAFEKNEL